MSLLKAGVFSSGPDALDRPETFRTPGYPALIAAVYGLTTRDQSMVILIQIVISTATMVLVYRIAESLWGQQTALVALILIALDFGCFAHSFRIMTETLFMFLLVCALRMCIPLLQNQSASKYAFCFGFSFALATMVRPVGYYLFFPLFLGLLFWSVHHRKSWVPVFFFVPFFLIVGGWQLRNYTLTGSASFSRITGLLFQAKAAEIVAAKDKITYEQAVDELEPKTLKRKDVKTKAQADQYWKKEGPRYLYQYPYFYLRREFSRSIRIATPSGFDTFSLFGLPMYMSPIEDVGRLKPRQYIQKWIVRHPVVLLSSILMMFHLYLLYIGGATAVWLGWKNRPVRTIHLFYGIVFSYFLAVSLAIGFRARFLLPAMPLLHLYAARAIILLHKKSDHLPANFHGVELQH